MKNKSLRLPIILIMVILALYGCVLAPLYQYLITDIVLQDTLWLDLVDLLFQYAETIGSVILLTFLVFGVYRYRLRGSKNVLIASACAIAFKYVATIIAISIEFGSLDLTGSLTPYLFAFLLELAIAASVVLLSHHWITPASDEYAARCHAASVLNKTLDEKDPCYPFSALISKKNPVQRTILVAIAIVVGWRLAAALVSEFTYGVMLKPGDIPVILIYWVILIFIPAICSYFLALPFFKLCVKCAKE